MVSFGPTGCGILELDGWRSWTATADGAVCQVRMARDQISSNSAYELLSRTFVIELFAVN